MLTRLQHVAVHEAGHAVAMLTAGVPVFCVHVRRSLAVDGVCVADPSSRRPDGVEWAAVIVAGDVAVQLCAAGLPAPESCAGSWYFDQVTSGPSDRDRGMHEARAVLSGSCVTGYSDAEQLERTAVPAQQADAHAREVLCANWSAVRAIANRLIESGRVEPAELEAIRARHGVAVRPWASVVREPEPAAADAVEVSMTRAHRRIESRLHVGYYVARRIARRLREGDGMIHGETLDRLLDRHFGRVW
jgi:hypothetical protein